ncbi:MAG: nucleotidyltransferase domain-containing protein [candidate division KSB1 bacterium]
MKFGLSQRDTSSIEEALSRFPEIEKAIVFGSRAMGNYKPGSDVDLAIVGAAITPTTVLRLRALLNEDLPLPYFIDVAHYEKIKNAALKQHIDHEGHLLFSRQV